MTDAFSRLRAVLDTPSNDTVGGVSILTISIIVLFWGVLAIVDAYRIYGRSNLPRWHPRRWVAPSFGFFLGWFLIMADGVIYFAIGLRILSSPEPLELGWAAYLMGCGTLAVAAFYYWARERLPRWSKR